MDLAIDHTSAVPPFEQLRSGIAALVAAGDLAPGERLPTVRDLAGGLGLAVNTVARAYRELEADGVVETQGRRGTFVSSRHLAASEGEVTEHAAALVAAARASGYSLQEALRLVERTWTT